MKITTIDDFLKYRSAKFQDKFALPQGVGKASNHVKIKNVKDAPKAALKYYIKQAVQLDAKYGRTSHRTEAIDSPEHGYRK
jgi:hypothetical protein